MAAAHSLSDVSPALAREDIVGGCWPSPDWQPRLTLGIVHPVSGKSVQLGNSISGVEAKEEPDIFFAAEPGQLYSLAYVDPDGPTREDPQAGNINHWLIPNLKAGKTPDDPVEKTTPAYVAYAGPSLKRSGHRMIFFLYKHKNGKPLKAVEEQKTIKGSNLEDRFFWDFPAFAEENELELVGANFFISKLHGQ